MISDELCWTPDPLLFEGETMVVIGGGPSVLDADVAILRDRNVKTMAIKQSLYLCPWADVLFFHEIRFFERNRAAIMAFRGLKVTGSRYVWEQEPNELKLVRTARRRDFTRGQADLKFGISSGHMGIVLSIALGCSKVILLGFDMRLVNGRSHWHDAYGTTDERVYSQHLLLYWDGWNDAAKAIGVDIVNCSEGSALNEFRRSTLERELNLS